VNRASSANRKLGGTTSREAKLRRYGFLFQEICSRDNLYKAHCNARKGKTNRTEVKAVDDDLNWCISVIQEMLLTETHEVSEYTVFKKHDGNKTREIYKLPYFPDRIIQWAILQVIGKYFDKRFIYDTYSSIKGRGIHFGVQRVKNSLKDRENTKYCLKMDVRKYYPSIDQSILKQKLWQLFKDIALLDLLFTIINSTKYGVPIGNYLSQYFANYYLSDYDHWMKERHREKYYHRYMDDVCILHKNKNRLHYLRRETNWYWKEKLNLEMKANWQIFPVANRGIDFLGYRFYHDKTMLRKRIKTKMKKKINRKNKPSYRGWLKWCDCCKLSEIYLRE